MFTTIATCAPYLPGFGFRAELQTDGRIYRLVSFDCSIPGETPWHPPSGPYGDPVERARCKCSDVREGAGRSLSGPERAELLCFFWSVYARRPEEFDRDAEDVEQVNRDWWVKWGEHLIGTDDDGSPLGWEAPE